METAIKWSPTSSLSSQRFLFADVSGRSFSLGTITHYDSTATPKLRYDLAPAFRRVPAFRALDWAPYDDSIVAVGTPAGETSVLRIDDNGPSVSFPAKYQRQCNAVAFSTSRVLATGLERVRNDSCLNIWDVNQRLLAPVSAAGTSIKTYVEPVRKLASSEAVASIKFFSGQPEILVVGVKGTGIRFYDLRDHASNPSMQFQTPCVHNIAIDSLDENYFASATSMKEPEIQIWDCRYGAPYSVPTLGSSLGSSLGSGSDRNGNQGPVITYKEIFQAGLNSRAKDVGPSVWSLRYCKGKSGFLGALASNGDFRVFETRSAYMANMDSPGLEHPDQPLKDSIPNISTKRVHSVERGFDSYTPARSSKERIVSFDFTNLAGSRGMPTAILLRGTQVIEIYEFNASPALSFSSSGTLAAGVSYYKQLNGQIDLEPQSFLEYNVNFMAPRQKNGQSQDQNQIRKLLLNGEVGIITGTLDENPRDDLVSSHQQHEDMCGIRKASKVSMEIALSISTVGRFRCEAGYCLDVERNLAVFAENQWLRRMWTWTQRAKSLAANAAMVSELVDLSYIGVYELWNQKIRFNKTSRRSSTATARQANLANAIETIAGDLSLPPLPIETDYPEHRQLCLYTLNLGLTPKQLEDYVKELACNGQQTESAFIALIHGENKLVAQCLRTGQLNANHKALSLALAGYQRGAPNDAWEETVKLLLQDISDPYGRAIFTFVRHGDWREVISETSLPLNYSIGIALLYLPDTDLSEYINSSTNEAIAKGDIEGICLTGLTEMSIPLFETYMRKFSDLQTTVLALSHVSPRYFTDPRVTVWRETYRSLMDKWGLHEQRATFDMQLTQLSGMSNTDQDEGRILSNLPNLAPLVALHCPECEQRNAASMASEPPAEKVHPQRIFNSLDGHDGTACPKCGRHMARCAICDVWLGMPTGTSKESGRKESDSENGIKMGTTFCQACSHSTHTGHAEQWFERNDECPVVGCNCQCLRIDE